MEMEDTEFLLHMVMFYYLKVFSKNKEEAKEVSKFSAEFMKPMKCLRSNYRFSDLIPAYPCTKSAVPYILFGLNKIDRIKEVSIDTKKLLTLTV